LWYLDEFVTQDLGQVYVMKEYCEEMNDKKEEFDSL